MEYAMLVPECLPDVLGCPDFAIERALRDATVELCERGHIWMVEQFPDAFVPNQEDIFLEIPPRARLVTVLSVKYGELQLTPYNPLDLDQFSYDWRTATGSPRAYTVLTDRTLKPIPMPVEPDATKFYVTFAVAPSLKSTGLPDELGNRWHQTLVAGALARLQSIPQVPWTDPQRADRNQALFERGVARAKYMAATARANANRVVFRAV